MRADGCSCPCCAEGGARVADGGSFADGCRCNDMAPDDRCDCIACAAVTDDSREPCPHGDPACPCPDGLQCHYEDDPATGTPAWPCEHCATEETP